MSSTATTAPRPPGAPRRLAIDQASGMSIPNGPQKFHCSPKPGSLGRNALAWARRFATAYSTRGSPRSSAAVVDTEPPSSIRSCLEPPGRASGGMRPGTRLDGGLLEVVGALAVVDDQLARDVRGSRSRRCQEQHGGQGDEQSVAPKAGPAVCSGRPHGPSEAMWRAADGRETPGAQGACGCPATGRARRRPNPRLQVLGRKLTLRCRYSGHGDPPAVAAWRGKGLDPRFPRRNVSERKAVSAIPRGFRRHPRIRSKSSRQAGSGRRLA